MKKIDGLSKDIERTEREKLASVFPQCFVEGKLDIDKLLSLCGEYILKDFEKYEFTWKGKSECLPLAQQRSTATLRPCPEESVNFDTTQNLYIEGDNLEVLKLLQTSYFRKIKMIYIDPPYNTGHDFVYEDDFSDTLARYKEVTSQTTKSNPESMGRFHTNWLNMMYPRLRLAANLLRDDGVIFISINNEEVHNLRKVCDEVFGEENFIECITWNKRVPKNDKGIGNIHEFILIYSKNYSVGHEFIMSKQGLEDIYTLVSKLKNKRIPISEAEKEIKKLYKRQGYDRGITLYNSFDSEYRLFGKINMSWPNAKTYGPTYDVFHPITGDKVPVPDRGWRWKEETFNEAANLKNGEYQNIVRLHDGSSLCGRVWFSPNSNIQPSSINYLDEVDTFLLRSVLSLKSDGGIEVEEILGGKNIFSYPKPTSLLEVLVKSITKEEDIILDFFSGSATTAHAVMKLNAEDGGNRRYIMVQLPELFAENSEPLKAGYQNICEIGKERIRRAGKKLTEPDAQLSLLENSSPLDTGFKVFKLDSSNLKIWDSSRFPEDDLLSISNRLNNMIDRVKSDRTDLDVVYEIMLKLGVPLTYSVTPLNIGPAGPQGRKTAYSVGDECLLIICLAENLTTEMIEKMAEYTPGQIVLAEHSLADLSAMRNAHYILKDRNIELKLV